ncbi:MAG: PhnD/SsuA/transferrin family substrate-binding protein [Gammaproteobacteria bacterium]|nr:PhnD/SsuA/transferrin family substrate-binding protein [Gammaproteobacteria bacterium]
MTNRIILCGMYTFSPALRNSWQQVLMPLSQSLSLPAVGTLEIRYSSTAADFQKSNLYIGHTCGYPFWKDFLKTHQVITVPEFTIEGCSGIDYSSWIVARASDPRESLEEFENARAIVNTHDSNSGMNVFRYEVSRVATGPRFFCEVKRSGSHLNSLAMIRAGTGDIAAIDAITFGLADHLHLINTSDFKILQQTQHSPGLPFIAHHQSRIDIKRVKSILNKGLTNLPQECSTILPIRKFSYVDATEYSRILELEQAAIEFGYPELA